MLNNHNQNIIAMFTLIAEAENFDANLFLELLIHTFKNIEDNAFKKIMRILWS